MTSKDEKPTVQQSGRRQTQLRIAVVCIALVLGGMTFLTVSQHKNIQRLLLWINDHPGIGFFIFGATYVWFTVLFLPPAILALAAGAVFGLWMGIILVWGSAVTGETLAFLLGRFLFRDIISQKAKHYPTWQALEGALKDDGWKLVALLRLAPVLPFTLVNYALGVSALPVVDEKRSLVDVYARSHITDLCKGNAYNRLQWEDVTVSGGVSLCVPGRMHAGTMQP